MLGLDSITEAVRELIAESNRVAEERHEQLLSQIGDHADLLIGLVALALKHDVLTHGPKPPGASDEEWAEHVAAFRRKALELVALVFVEAGPAFEPFVPDALGAESGR